MASFDLNDWLSLEINKYQNVLQNVKKARSAAS